MYGITSSNNVYDQNHSLIDEYRKAFRLTDKDNVQIYVLPKGKAGKTAGSFIYKPMSNKAQRLTFEHNRCKRKIQELEMGILDMPKNEQSKALIQLRNTLRYITNALNAETASLPQSGYIVVEEDSDD